MTLPPVWTMVPAVLAPWPQLMYLVVSEAPSAMDRTALAATALLRLTCLTLKSAPAASSSTPLLTWKMPLVVPANDVASLTVIWLAGSAMFR